MRAFLSLCAALLFLPPSSRIYTYTRERALSTFYRAPPALPDVRAQRTKYIIKLRIRLIWMIYNIRYISPLSYVSVNYILIIMYVYTRKTTWSDGLFIGSGNLRRKLRARRGVIIKEGVERADLRLPRTIMNEPTVSRDAICTYLTVGKCIFMRAESRGASDARFFLPSLFFLSFSFFSISLPTAIPYSACDVSLSLCVTQETCISRAICRSLLPNEWERPYSTAYAGTEKWELSFPENNSRARVRQTIIMRRNRCNFSEKRDADASTRSLYIKCHYFVVWIKGERERVKVNRNWRV